jgi:hypothetical protein
MKRGVWGFEKVVASMRSLSQANICKQGCTTFSKPHACLHVRTISRTGNRYIRIGSFFK